MVLLRLLWLAFRVTLNPPGQYADDRHLRARQRFWRHQDPPLDIVTWVLDLAGLAPGMRVLDAGCGNGLYLRGLTSDNKNIIERFPGQVSDLATMISTSGAEGVDAAGVEVVEDDLGRAEEVGVDRVEVVVVPGEDRGEGLMTVATPFAHRARHRARGGQARRRISRPDELHLHIA